MCFLISSLAYLKFLETNAIEQSPTMDHYPVLYLNFMELGGQFLFSDHDST